MLFKDENNIYNITLLSITVSTVLQRETTVLGSLPRRQMEGGHAPPVGKIPREGWAALLGGASPSARLAWLRGQS